MGGTGLAAERSSVRKRLETETEQLGSCCVASSTGAAPSHQGSWALKDAGDENGSTLRESIVGQKLWRWTCGYSCPTVRG